MGFLKPKTVFLICATEKLLMGKLLFFSNDPSKFGGLIRRMLNPMAKQSLEEILTHVLRSMGLQAIQHVEEVIGNPSMLGLMYYIDADLHLFPEGKMAFSPRQRTALIHQRSFVQVNPATSPRGGVVKELGEVLLGLCGPSGQVGTQPRDGLAHNVKGPIIFPEGGPCRRQLHGASNGRETLKLLNLDLRLVTMQIHHETTVRLPWDVPINLKGDTTNQSLGDQQIVNHGALKGGGPCRADDLSLEPTLNDGGR